MLLGDEPGEQGGSDAANMQKTCRARRETRPDTTGRASCRSAEPAVVESFEG